MCIRCTVNHLEVEGELIEIWAFFELTGRFMKFYISYTVGTKKWASEVGSPQLMVSKVIEKLTRLTPKIINS